MRRHGIEGDAELFRGRACPATVGKADDDRLAHHVRSLHLRAARRNGVTEEELREVLLQTAIYCGVPAANSAFRLAEETLGP